MNIIKANRSKKIAKIKSLAESSPRTADKVIQLIADNIGDEAVAKIVGELSPVALNSIFDEHDETGMSTAIMLAPPQSIVEALLYRVAEFGCVDDKRGFEYFTNLDQMLLDFFACLFFVNDDRQRQFNILQSIVDDELAAVCLIFPFPEGWKSKREKEIEIEFHNNLDPDIDPLERLDDELSEEAQEVEMIEEKNYKEKQLNQLHELLVSYGIWDQIRHLHRGDIYLIREIRDEQLEKSVQHNKYANAFNL